MSRENARNAAASEHVATMGPELGPMYYTLWQHTVRAYNEWLEYRTLFGSGADRFNHLKSVSAKFFMPLDDIMYESVLLNITRLTGRRSSGRAPNAPLNITIRALPAMVDASIQNAVEDAVTAAIAAAQFAVDARDKWIAHLDAATMLYEQAAEFNMGSRIEVHDALAAITRVLNVVSEHYEGLTNNFELKRRAGADRVLELLALGVAAEEARPVNHR